MTQQVHKDVKGLYPALDRKKLAEPYVVDGKNFIVDLDGPKSAFGFKQPWHEFDESNFMQSFPIGSEIFYFSRDAAESFVQISQVDWLTQTIIHVNRFSANAGRPKLNLPWTHALVGTYHYFANRTWGVLQYDAITQNWSDVTTTIGISSIFFITESDGRLITLAEGLTSWSAIEDGMDNTPDIATGAGFQGLSKIGSLESNADYLGLQKIANGYLSFTSKGVMRSQIIDSISPFRHITGETQEAPLTAWCITKVTDTDVVILTRHGLFKSKDGLFSAWQPLMGEFFKQTMIPPLQQVVSGYIAIYYSQARDEFYVSFASSQVVAHYTITYVLYLVREEWGIFNRTHQGFVFIDPESRGIEFQQAYISLDGHLNWLNDSSIPLVLEPQNVQAVYIPAAIEFPPFSIEDTVIFSTRVRAAGFSSVAYPQISGFYEELGVQSCFKTETANPCKCVQVPPEDIYGTWQLKDYSAEHIGGLWSAFDPIVSLVGVTYRLDWTFVKGTSNYVRMTLDTGHENVSLVGIDFLTCICATFTGVAGMTGSVIALDDDEYILRAEWTVQESYELFYSVKLHPAYGEFISALTGTVYSKSVSLYKTTDVLTELLPEPTNFGDTNYWLPNFISAHAIWPMFSTTMSANASLCVLGPVSQPHTQLPLDSFIEVGLLRFTDEETNDEFSLITQLAISCLDTAEDSGSVIDDWLNDYATDITEDWLAADEETEDWGLELASGSAYSETIRGTRDGYRTFEDQEATPALELLDGKTKFLTCENQGIFQTVRLEASEVGESFHLKTLELNGMVAGRL